jgi:hypothetical protein
MKPLFLKWINPVISKEINGIKKTFATTMIVTSMILSTQIGIHAENYPKNAAQAEININYSYHGDIEVGAIYIGFLQGARNTQSGVSKVLYRVIPSHSSNHLQTPWIIRNIILKNHKDIDLNKIINLGKSRQVFALQLSREFPSEEAPITGSISKSIIGDTVTVEFEPGESAPKSLSGVIMKVPFFFFPGQF